MSKRFFTSDFHVSMVDILRFENRPFSTIEKMNTAILKTCNDRAKFDDTIIHVGDLFCYGTDKGIENTRSKPTTFLDQINANFINIRGNHDINNKVKSLCESMRTTLGKVFKSVSISHYPTYNIHCKNNFLNGDIHLCGHVHGKWKHCIDLDHQCLNVNVGLDVWKYRIVSEDELIIYLNKLLKTDINKLHNCKVLDGQLKFFNTEQRLF